MSLRKILAVAVVWMLFPTHAPAQEPDWGAYAGVLQRHLSRKTEQGIELAWVNYSALRQDGAWAGVVKQVADYPPHTLADGAERMAFYINTYNVLAMQMVMGHWPVASIKDPGNLLRPVWKLPAGKAAGAEVTLHQVEHEILRPMKDPRIHLAIVCASLSCPDLRPEPYTAEKLDGQLEDQTRRFLQNPAKGLRVEGETIHLSKIFDWFEADFGHLEGFIRRYRPDLPSGLALETDIPYNWSLNGQ